MIVPFFLKKTKTKTKTNPIFAVFLLISNHVIQRMEKTTCEYNEFIFITSSTATTRTRTTTHLCERRRRICGKDSPWRGEAAFGKDSPWRGEAAFGKDSPWRGEAAFVTDCLNVPLRRGGVRGLVTDCLSSSTSEAERGLVKGCPQASTKGCLSARPSGGSRGLAKSSERSGEAVCDKPSSRRREVVRDKRQWRIAPSSSRRRSDVRKNPSNQTITRTITTTNHGIGIGYHCGKGQDKNATQRGKTHKTTQTTTKKRKKRICFSKETCIPSDVFFFIVSRIQR